MPLHTQTFRAPLLVTLQNIHKFMPIKDIILTEAESPSFHSVTHYYSLP
jgi:hypothetical protein